MTSIAWMSAVIALSLPSSTTSLEASAEKHLRVLADPKFEGRMTLREGNVRAADYLIREFKQLGLVPLENKSYLHPFEIRIGSRMSKNNVARIELGSKSTTLTPQVDYVPLIGSATMRIATGEVMYFGHELPTGNLSGQIIALLRNEKEGSPRFNDRLTAALDGGAKGIILVGPGAQGRSELPSISGRGRILPASANVVGIAMTLDAFNRSGMLAKGTRARLITEVEPNSGTSNNVIAVLPGNDPKLKDEYIILGAHFDHLGYGEVGSRSGSNQLHNGADDNGSGTAGLIAMAEYFAKTGTNRRTMIFQGYSGEEVGLVGSLAWVRDHPELIKKTHLMVNMDMIGRLRNEKLIIYCTESSQVLNKLVQEIKVPGVTPSYPPGVPGNSDHAGFVRAGVPSLFYHTDLHPEYHTENDTLATINFAGIGMVLEHVRQLVEKADALNEKLVFSQPTTQANRPTGTTAGEGSPSRRVRTGFLPDMASTALNGLRLTGAAPGSPAEKAGIKEGDFLLEFDGKAIRSIDDLQQVLMSAKPDVKVKIKIRRGDQVLDLEITPTAAG